ncbi:MAG: EI24 domain-containing protein [Planctomycetota bacterium]|nr:EI24 domain-containing protein [Planctomycetota bacterium]
MRPSGVKPCPTCGYHAPTSVCPHCGGAPREASLTGPPPRGLAEIGAGLTALPRGFAILLTMPRTKRLLIPPFLITFVVYSVAFLVGWRAFASTWNDLVTSEPWASLLEAGTFLVSVVVFAFVFAWTFALVYQAIAAPFFDTMQGRIEARWFGADPRETITRDLASGRTTAGKVIALSSDQARSLLVSLEASIVAGAIMLCFLWVLFVPIVGHPTFAGVAGFAASIALVDIPCSRRDWSLARRLRFVFGHFLPFFAFGVTTSLVFLIPFAGPIVAVPSAAVGGLWLLVRLDKSRL